ncbi:hypothetical protein [Bacteroides sp. KG122]|uniref:hypothetical protein n=1 Tax=Bacteroides sp. KG122 TaxID=3397827 RepID=UPI003D963E36
MHLSDGVDAAGLKGSLLFRLTAVNRRVQGISARQDAAPRLWPEQPPVPNQAWMLHHCHA